MPERIEERRERLRVQLRLNVEILIEGTHLMGFTSNLSLTGAMVEVPNADLDRNLKGKVGVVWLVFGDNELLEFKCTPIRVSGSQLGIQFIDQDVEPTLRLRRFIESRL